MNAHAVSGTDADARALVLLQVGPWFLALPRRDVRELLSPDPHGGAPTRSGAGPMPLLALDDTLTPVSVVPPQRRVCVVVDGGAGLYVLPCDEFHHQIGADAVIRELPTASRGARSPVQAVLWHSGGVAALTDARALAKHFALQWANETERV